MSGFRVGNAPCDDARVRSDARAADGSMDGTDTDGGFFATTPTRVAASLAARTPGKEPRATPRDVPEARLRPALADHEAAVGGAGALAGLGPRKSPIK